jgi:hypothetical protein
LKDFGKILESIKEDPMKSDVIHVTNEGAGFDKALAQAEATARFLDLDRRDALHLRLLTEEMTGMMRALTG